MLLAFAATLHAAELSPGLAMPSAVALEPGGGQAALGALVAGGDSPLASATLRGAVGITDRLALSGGLLEPWGGLLLGVRYNVVQTDAFRFAPFVFGVVNDDLVTEDAPEAAEALSAGIGVALEGGGRTFRYDLSLPLVATGVDPIASPLFVPLTGTTLGATLRLTSWHALRVGVESLFAPALTWRYARERWYLQAAGMYSVVRRVPMVHAEAGLRF